MWKLCKDLVWSYFGSTNSVFFSSLEEIVWKKHIGKKNYVDKVLREILNIFISTILSVFRIGEKNLNMDSRTQN